MINKHYEPCENESEGVLLTATDIKVYLEKMTGQKLTLDRIGKELSRLKYAQIHKRFGLTTKRVYVVKFADETCNTQFPNNQPFGK